MISPYKLVVFDWEGTIADTLGAVFQVVATEAQKLGFEPLDPEQAKKYVDLGLSRALQKIYPQLSSQQNQELIAAVQNAMYFNQNDVYIFPGVLDLLQKLQSSKVHLAIATNKGQHSLDKALEASGLKSIFKITRSAGQTAAKPDPQMLEEIMAEFGCDISDTIMIGDSVSDIQMATQIGVRALGFDRYHQQTLALSAAGALAVFDDYIKLEQFLEIK